ncbi:MAG: tRNA (adenosine(37)-N6)-dimethylallyltransferase MiaA [Bacilli bacterium]|nr:tRNA (adenosine(37)-N6)-dimethylallyltransferase MiaA [Bacilli bacterium]
MNKVIVITGPTATGKTRLSIELAKTLNGEIINADSTQVYKGLDIATAKVTEAEKCGVIHHLIDIKDINEDYTVFDYQKDVRKLIAELFAKGKTPILVGGTGLYIKAALYDYQFEEEEIKNDFNELSNEEIYKKLVELDSDIKIHINNRKRLIRALNYIQNNNKPFSKKEKNDKLLYGTIFIGLTTDRQELYKKINYRVDSMIDLGLINEAERLYKMNIRNKAVMTPIGYKELLLYFDKIITLEEAIDLIKQRSRKYAKRQYTWFNNQMNIKWFDVNYEDFNQTTDVIIKYINSKVN